MSVQSPLATIRRHNRLASIAKLANAGGSLEEVLAALTDHAINTASEARQAARDAGSRHSEALLATLGGNIWSEVADDLGTILSRHSAELDRRAEFTSVRSVVAYPADLYGVSGTNGACRTLTEALEFHDSWKVLEVKTYAASGAIFAVLDWGGIAHLYETAAEAEAAIALQAERSSR